MTHTALELNPEIQPHLSKGYLIGKDKIDSETALRELCLSEGIGDWYFSALAEQAKADFEPDCRRFCGFRSSSGRSFTDLI